MATTVTIDQRLGSRGGHAVSNIVTVDMGTYATNGVALTAAQCGLSRIDAINFFSVGAGISYAWDSSASKIKAFWVDTTVDGAAQAEVANSTDLSNYDFRAEVIGLP